MLVLTLGSKAIPPTPGPVGKTPAKPTDVDPPVKASAPAGGTVPVPVSGVPDHEPLDYRFDRTPQGSVTVVSHKADVPIPSKTSAGIHYIELSEPSNGNVLVAMRIAVTNT